MASNDIWTQLTQVCVELGLRDEALQWFAKVEASSERFHLQNLLVRHGYMDRPDTHLQAVTEEETQNRALDDVQEAITFLADDHMPTTVTVMTAMFPVAVGIGGYFASGSSTFILPVLAMLPALLVLMVVVALSRRVLVDASTGIEDAPKLPTMRKLRSEALQSGGHTLAVTLALLLPGALLLVLGVSPIAGILTVLAGAMLLPMAVTLRMVRNDWQALSPAVLLPAVFHGGTPYLSRALICVGLFVPAALCWYLSSNTVYYLQLALVGPMVVAPLLVSARLMGRFIQTHRSELGAFANLRELAPKAAQPEAVKPQVKPRKEPKQSRPSKAPKAPAHRAQRQTKPARPVAKRKPQRKAAPQPRPVAAAATAPAPAKRRPRVTADEMPDLLNMPGVNVVRGQDRGRVGAAATGGVEQKPVVPASLANDMPDLLNMPGVNIVRGADRARAGASPARKRQRPN